MSDFRQQFLKFALEQEVLKFGEFITKAGRPSPYFFNAAAPVTMPRTVSAAFTRDSNGRYSNRP